MSRQPNFTRNEELVLMEAVEQRKDALFSAFSGPGLTKKRRDETWKTITDAFNSQFIGAHLRTTEQLKKKYKNIKTHATSKASQMKRPVTGGGPPPSPPTTAEELFLSLNGDCPGVRGIPGGLDSEVQPNEDLRQIITIGVPFDLKLPEAACTPTENIETPIETPSVSTSDVLFPPPGTTKTRKPRSDKVASDLRIELMQLEKRRIEAQLELAHMQLCNEQEYHRKGMELVNLKILAMQNTDV